MTSPLRVEWLINSPRYVAKITGFLAQGIGARQTIKCV